MTKYCNFALDLQSIRNANRNRSNGGGGFVFVGIFGIEARLDVCEIPKIPTSAKDLPQNKLYPHKDTLALKTNTPLIC